MSNPYYVYTYKEEQNRLVIVPKQVFDTLLPYADDPALLRTEQPVRARPSDIQEVVGGLSNLPQVNMPEDDLFGIPDDHFIRMPL